MDEDGVGEHVARARLGALDHVDRLLDRVGCERLPGIEQPDQLFEEERGAIHLVLVARDRDLVAAHEDRRIEGALDQLEELVALAQQTHHRMVPGNQDLQRVGFGHPVSCAAGTAASGPNRGRPAIIPSERYP